MLWLGSVLAITAAVAAHPNAYADVHVGSVKLRVPIPGGFCIPQGKDATRFEDLAAADHRNVTLLSLSECRDTPANRYLLIKTPVAAVNLGFDRGEFLKALSASYREEDFADTMRAVPGEVGAAKSAATGVPTSLRLKFGPRGSDDVCVYLGGSMTTIKRGKPQHQAMGSCTTVVGNRAIVLYSYEDTKKTEAYKALLPKLKAWASKIRPVPASR